MQNLKFFLIAAAVLVAVFFLGKCSANGKDAPKPQACDCPADTVFIRKLDTLKIEVPVSVIKTVPVVTQVDDQPEKDSTLAALAERLDYYQRLTQYYQGVIAELGGLIPPAAVESEVEARNYKGDTTTQSGVKVAYEIDVLGYLQGNPCFTIDYFQSVVQPTKNPKNRGIGIIGGVRQDFRNDETQWSPGLYYRRGAGIFGARVWYDVSGFKFSKPLGGEVFSGVELQWRKRK